MGYRCYPCEILSGAVGRVETVVGVVACESEYHACCFQREAGNKSVKITVIYG